MKRLVEIIFDRSATAAVIGLGYVGLPLALEIARAGFKTIGIDSSWEKVEAVSAGNNYIRDVDSSDLRNLVCSGKLIATTNCSVLDQCDFISICVPTPLGKGKDPDMSFVMSAVSEVKKHLKREQVIILESTTFP